MISYYGKELLTLKANLHTHTAKSDGQLEPQDVITRYAEKGYDVLSLTDHRQTHDPSQYDSKGMLMISGIEVHPKHAKEGRYAWHVVGLNVPLDFKYCRAEDHGLSIQQTIDALREAGALPFIAHPYWCNFSSADILPVTGYYGIEVCNTECRSIGRGYSMQTWDELLYEGLNVNATAVDDMHGDWALGQSWTVVCAEERTVESVLEALKKGSYYASQGPEFKSLSYENGIFKAEFTPVESAQLITPTWRKKNAIFPECEYAGAPRKEVDHMEIDVTDLPEGAYFRCQLVDKYGHYAWTNPIRIENKKITGDK